MSGFFFSLLDCSMNELPKIVHWNIINILKQVVQKKKMTLFTPGTYSKPYSSSSKSASKITKKYIVLFMANSLKET